MEIRRERKEERKELCREGFQVMFTEKKRICMNVTRKQSSVKGKDGRFWLVNKVVMLLLREGALREDTASITL